MQISIKHLMTKIVFNKNPVENTGLMYYVILDENLTNRTLHGKRNQVTSLYRDRQDLKHLPEICKINATYNVEP